MCDEFQLISSQWKLQMHIYLFTVKQISNATKWNTNSRAHFESLVMDKFFFLNTSRVPYTQSKKHNLIQFFVIPWIMNIRIWRKFNDLSFFFVVIQPNAIHSWIRKTKTWQNLYLKHAFECRYYSCLLKLKKWEEIFLFSKKHIFLRVMRMSHCRRHGKNQKDHW